MALNRDGFLKPKALRRETVNIKSVGDTAVMRELSLDEWLACNKRFAGVSEGDNVAVFKAALAQVATALCNPEDGSPMFAEDEIDATVEELMKLPSATAQDLIRESNRIQGLDSEPIKEAVGN